MCVAKVAPFVQAYKKHVRVAATLKLACILVARQTELVIYVGYPRLAGESRACNPKKKAKSKALPPKATAEAEPVQSAS